jgi:inosine/xanthosine triphosphate pyrophosphatase family protein
MDAECILLATTNPAKAERLTWLVIGLPLAPCLPSALGLQLPPHMLESGDSFVENAAEKACAWSVLAPGILALASDGGLRIPALGRTWDELRTKRNGGEGASSSRRISYLLGLMDGFHGADRATVWCEALALARDGVLLNTWTASGDGGVLVDHYSADKSDDAFWTESIRMQPTLGKLYRDMSEEEVARFDAAWPTLREQVRTYFLRP